MITGEHFSSDMGPRHYSIIQEEVLSEEVSKTKERFTVFNKC
jgi:hypothetical protein